MSSRVLITGISGQDGSWLAENLVSHGHEVHGIVRRHSVAEYPNLAALLAKDAVRLHEADLTDLGSLEEVVGSVAPDEIYNLGAMSHVGTSFSQPELTMDVTAFGAWRVMEAARRHARTARVYQASSSEMYGDSLDPRGKAGPRLADERTPFRPVSPYGTAKVTAHNLAAVFRDSYGMDIRRGVLFNHESERRGAGFVTRKITLGLARVALGLQDRLELGNLEAVRDWGYAPEYVEAMRRIMAHSAPEGHDFVIATGKGYSVERFLSLALREVAALAGVPEDRLRARVHSDASHRRPTDIPYLVGDPSAAERVLRWKAETPIHDLVLRMARHDLAAVRAEIRRQQEVSA